ncbi:pinopsin-like [Littorina saxatilis]|uniref:pinopsin-like n=1 Tax=Littorina saxatilis TaxID=31220 RepID=UPI0038B5D331
MPNSTRLFPMTFSPTVEPSDTGDHGEIDMYNNYPHKISDMGYTVVASLLTVTWVSGTLLNIFSLVVFLSNKRLRSPTNMFVMSLNFCDLCMSCFGTFMAMTSSWNGRWLYGRTGCLFEGFMVYFLGMASMYLLCAISVDRYVVIAKPLLGAKINHMVAGLSIAACWIGGFMWAAFPLFGWNEYVLEGAGVSCSVVWETSNSNYTSYIFVIFVFCLVIPLAVMGFSYYGVFMTIKSMSKGRDKTSRIAKRNMKVEKKMAKTIFVMLGKLTVS